MSSARCLPSACQNFRSLCLAYSIHHRFRLAYLSWLPFHISQRALKRSVLPLSLSNRVLTFHSLLIRSQWPRGLRRRSAAARLLRSWVRIPPGAWMSVCCECCVLSGRGLCDKLTTRPENYRLCCVAVCDVETSSMRSHISINCEWN